MTQPSPHDDPARAAQSTGTNGAAGENEIEASVDSQTGADESAPGTYPPDTTPPDTTPPDTNPSYTNDTTHVEAVPIIHRLQTRLALLILLVVAVLAGATAIQVTRAFEQARRGVIQLNGAAPTGPNTTGPNTTGQPPTGQPPTGPATAPPTPLDLSGIVRSTLINLAAIFLFTLVGATVFSRRLLTDPIVDLVRATRELAAGRLGVTLPVTSRSELGLLADGFNHMSTALAHRTRQLVATNEALSVSEARYQLAIEGANDGLWDWDVAGGGMYYSPRWAGLLGRADDALEPTVATWKALAHPDDSPALEAALDAHVAGASPTFQLEHRLRHADDHWVWVLARGAALRGADGRAVRVAGSITDITERVEAVSLLERRVRERTADLAALLELSNSTALTLELHPLLAQILERLEAAVGCTGATVFEQVPDGTFRRLAGRGAEPGRDPELLAAALAARKPRNREGGGGARLAVPLVVRDVALGALLLEQPQRDAGGERRRLTVAFANQLAVALENARLYQQVGERAALEERQHLARELHDSVSQALYAILLGTHTAQHELAASPDAARQALEYVENLAQAGIKEMRALIFVLRPESLEKEGLIGVLRKQLDVLETRHDLGVTLEAPAEPAADVATKQALYRIAQEALHNVVKHARAANVRVALTSARGRVRLSISDDGAGFSPRVDDPEHLGLRSMEERARQIHGTLRVESREGAGTTVTVEAPCGPGDEGAKDDPDPDDPHRDAA